MRIYRKSEGMNRECYALRCNDYDIKITDTVRGEGNDIFATFSKYTSKHFKTNSLFIKEICFQWVRSFFLSFTQFSFHYHPDCWNQWSSWSNCTYGECGFQMGTKTRNRTCLCDEFTSFGVESCPNDNNQTIPCDPSWGSDDCPLGIWVQNA